MMTTSDDKTLLSPKDDERKLLELAAKAAGIKLLDWSEISEAYRTTQPLMYWNPLTDDGDALRLAVKLNLIIEFYKTYVYVYYSMSEKTFEEDHDGYPYAATRRAIVRAAAEIGKTL